MTYATYPSLKDRAVMISGGATGIGESLVRAFAAQGCRVGFVDIAVGAGQNLAAELTQAGLDAHFIACDVTDIAAYQSAIEAFAVAKGPVRVLINNAAHDERHDWKTVTSAEWDARMAVNLKHAFFAIQAVAPGMIAAGGGSIVNMGSISWLVMIERIPTYLAAKAAAHGLTRAMARELGKQGVRVNTIVPGAVITERQLRLWVDEAFERHLDAMQALAGRVMPDDIARMALFLASDDSAMISAQDFLVDGGWAHS